MTVNLAFSGTATLTNDYLRSGTQIVIPVGSTIGSVTVSAVNDAVANEPSEFIAVDIDSVINARERRAQRAVLEISNAAGVQLAVDRTLVAESGTATITASLLQARTQDTEVTISFSGGARLGSDYTVPGAANPTQPTRQIVIPAGQLTGAIVVTTIKDAATESDETLIADISLVQPSGIALEDGVQQVITTITDSPRSSWQSIKRVSLKRPEWRS